LHLRGECFVPRHLAIFTSDAPLALPEAEVIGFHVFDNTDVRITNSFAYSSVSKRNIHIGIEFRVFIDGDDPRAAMEPARLAAEMVCNFVSATHAIAVPHVVPRMVVNIDEEGENRPFAQFFYNVPSERKPLRPLGYETLRLMAEGWSRLPPDDPVREAVNRALWHLRKSAHIDDLLQRFIELWVGLEALNKSIQTRFALPRETSTRNCPKCGADVVSISVSSGVKYSLKTWARCTDAQWRAVSKVRQMLLHGFGDLPRHYDQIAQHADWLRDGLTGGIVALCGLPAEETSTLFHRQPMRRVDGPDLVIMGQWDNLRSTQILEAPRVPRLVLAGLSFPDDSEGTEKRDVNPQFRIVDFQGTMSNVSVDFTVRHDPEALRKSKIGEPVGKPDGS
jgi:hypothetical protein